MKLTNLRVFYHLKRVVLVGIAILSSQKIETQMTLEVKLTPLAEKYCNASNGIWRYCSYIAEGNSAAVFRIEGSDGPAALKIYDPIFFDGDEGAASLHRVEAHKELIGHNCPYLIQILDAGPFDSTAFVLMEFLPWQELAERISYIKPDEIWMLTIKLAEAAKYLEDRSICHRDIKPENIAISNDHQTMKLLDLGILRSTDHVDGAGSDEDGKKPFIGTVQYSSPEYLIRVEEPGL